MTLRETFNKLKQQNDVESLNAFYEKYEFLFNMPAKTLCDEIITYIKESNKELKLTAVFEIEGNLYELQNLPEKEQLKETISTSISIKNKSKTKKICLIKNSSANNYDEFKFGKYNINIFDLLLNDEIEDSNLIHKACWKAIAKNLKQNLEEENNKTI